MHISNGKINNICVVLQTSPVHLGINGDDDGNSSLNSSGDCFDDSTLYPPAKRQRRDSFQNYLEYPKGNLIGITHIIAAEIYFHILLL